MKPDLSEFSYGYALTEDLIRSSSMSLTAAPVFPSLLAEGKEGGGWDLRLDRPSLPLFLQFKTSHCMERIGSTTEYKRGLFSSSFYRFHLRARNRSNQHEMLLALENEGNEVYYVAPLFHKMRELNDSYLRKQIVSRSVFVPPSVIGELPDDKEHHVAFQTSSTFYVLSEPQQRTGALDGEAFIRHIVAAFQQRARPLTETVLRRMSSQLQNIVERNPQPPRLLHSGDTQGTLFGDVQEDALLGHHAIDHNSFEEQQLLAMTLRNLQQLPPLEQVAYTARAFFNSQLFILGDNKNATYVAD